MNKIITISRQFASGGREIGKKLADRFGIPYFDNEILRLAAIESGISEEAFVKAEEKAASSLIYSIAMSMNAYGFQNFGTPFMTFNDQAYMVQADIIRKVAKEGPCVIIGRCADYVLQDYPNVINIFVWASIKNRIDRAIDVYGMSHARAEENILKTDKTRANYYRYHSDKKWGNLDNYHLSIRSDFVGVEGTVDCIAEYIERNCCNVEKV